MYRKIFSTFFALSFLFALQAQVTIAPQVPQSGILIKNQLWNVSIVSSEVYNNVSLILTVVNAANGDPMFSATTSRVNLIQGANQFDFNSLSPINYEYQSPDFTDHNPDGFMMAGHYTAEYAISLPSHGATVNENISLNIEPLSPPMLNTPTDEEVVQTHTPQFTWIPPVPLEIYTFLNYDYKLVEVSEGQNPLDAIQQNIPVLIINQTQPYLNYPASAAALDTGKVYAWQITAKNEEDYSAQSEVWTFSIANLPVLPDIPIINNYFKLKRNLDGSIGTAISSLNAYYENEAEDTTVGYQIFDISTPSENDETYREVKFGTIPLHTGQNFIIVPLSSSEEFDADKLYLFQLTNSRNEKWSVKFTYIKAK